MKAAPQHYIIVRRGRVGFVMALDTEGLCTSQIQLGVSNASAADGRARLCPGPRPRLHWVLGSR